MIGAIDAIFLFLLLKRLGSGLFYLQLNSSFHLVLDIFVPLCPPVCTLKEFVEVFSLVSS
jgi:hypothetical protein